MDAIRLSGHFWLPEFTTSQAAARMGRTIEAGPDIQDALRELCVNVLEPVRAKFGAVIVSSGYRPVWLNEALAGTARSSQHQLGQAADFICPRHTVENVARWIADPANRVPFDQVIWEFDRWVHVSYSARQRREVLTAKHDGSRTVYSPGLVPFTEAAA